MQHYIIIILRKYLHEITHLLMTERRGEYEDESAPFLLG